MLKYTLLIFIIASCTLEPDQEASKLQSINSLPESETLRMAILSDPVTLDWSKTDNYYDSWLESLLMDGLTKWDFSKKIPEISPGLAISWQSNQNGSEWHFNIRQKVYWSDGVELTAEHIRDGLMRTLNPETLGKDAGFLFYIKNAKAFNEGKIEAAKVGIKVVGKYQLKFILEQPISFFPKFLSKHFSYPIRLDLLKKYGENWTQPGKMISLGPYLLKKYKHGQYLVLESNPRYWGRKVSIKNVVIHIIDDQTTQISLFKKNKIDYIHEIPIDQVEFWKNSPRYKSHSVAGITYIGFNVTKAPFDNRLARKAIQKAINKKLVSKAIKNLYPPLNSWYPDSLSNYALFMKDTSSGEKARELWRRLGLGKDNQSIRLGYNNSDYNERIMEAIQFQITEKLDIRVDLKNNEWKTHIFNINSKNQYEAFRLGWTGATIDPETFMSILTSNHPQNLTGWSNKKYDELVHRASIEFDKSRRRRLYKEANRIIHEEAPAIPIVSYTRHSLVSQRLKNVKLNQLDDLRVHEWTIE